MIQAMSIHDSKRRRLTQSPAASIAAIPEDLLASEVFSHLPVEDLLRVKSVCRSWRAAVADPAFVRRHLALARSRSPPLTFLVIPREDDPDDGASQPEDNVYFHRLALDEARTAADVELMFKKASPTGMAGAIVPTHCDGLVALATANGRACVCNPATREFVALPPGARGSKGAAALCYDRWRDRYVVVRCFYRRYDEYQDAASGKRKLDYEIGHEVFTPGDSSSWEPTADPPLAIGPADPVCTRDAVYWCTDDDDTLLRFSLRYRAFDVASGPPSAGSCCGNRTVTGLGGKLCYVACNRWSEGGYDVWVADADGGKLEWSLRCHVGIDLFGRPGVGEDALLPVFAAAEEDEMILAADFKQVYLYGAGSVQEVVDLEEEMAQENPDGTPKIMVYHVLP